MFFRFFCSFGFVFFFTRFISQGARLLEPGLRDGLLALEALGLGLDLAATDPKTGRGETGAEAVLLGLVVLVLVAPVAPVLVPRHGNCGYAPRGGLVLGGLVLGGLVLGGLVLGGLGLHSSLVLLNLLGVIVHDDGG